MSYGISIDVSAVPLDQDDVRDFYNCIVDLFNSFDSIDDMAKFAVLFSLVITAYKGFHPGETPSEQADELRGMIYDALSQLQPLH